MIRHRSQRWRALLAEEPFARRFCKRLARSPEDVEEWIQDAWVAALKHPPRSNHPRVIRAWWATVLWRTARGSRRRPPVESLVDALVVPDRRTDLGTLQGAERRTDRIRLLHEALSKLPRKSQALIRERHLEGGTPTEMARARGIAPEALRNRLARAMAHLKLQLERRARSDRGEGDRFLGVGVFGLGSVPSMLRVRPGIRTALLAFVPAAAAALLALRLPDPATPRRLEFDTRSAAAEALDADPHPRTSVRVGRDSAFPEADPRVAVGPKRGAGTGGSIRIAVVDGNRGTPLPGARFGRASLRSREELAGQLGGGRGSGEPGVPDSPTFAEIFRHLETPAAPPDELGQAGPRGDVLLDLDGIGDDVLWFAHPGYAAGYVSASALRDQMNVALRPGADVTVTVLDPAGRPSPGIELELRVPATGPDDRWFEGGREILLARPLVAERLGLAPRVRTDPGGRISLTGIPRGHPIALRRGGSGPTEVPWTLDLPVLPSSAAPLEFTWQLPAHADLEVVHPLPPCGELAWSWRTADSRLPSLGCTRGSLTEFRDLPGGPGTLVAVRSTSGGFETWHRSEHTLEPGCGERLTVPALVPRAALAGSILRPADGRIHDEYFVRVHAAGSLVAEQRLGARDGFGFELPWGRVELEVCLGSRSLRRIPVELPVESLRVDLSTGFGTLQVQVPRGALGTTASEPHALEVPLLIEYLDGRSVHAALRLDPESLRGQVPTLPPGVVTVSAGFGPRGLTTTASGTIIAGHRTLVRLGPVPRGKLVGEVRDRAGGTSVHARVRLHCDRAHLGSPWLERRLRVDGHGRFRAPGLGAGSWTVEARDGDGYGVLEIIVGGGGPSPWVAPPIVLGVPVPKER